jgi:hypothetical protein
MKRDNLTVTEKPIRLPHMIGSNTYTHVSKRQTEKEKKRHNVTLSNLQSANRELPGSRVPRSIVSRTRFTSPLVLLSKWTTVQSTIQSAQYTTQLGSQSAYGKSQ